MRNTLLLLSVIVFSVASLIACKKKENEKEKVGYQKVFHNIYKGDRFIFNFIDSNKCLMYFIENNVVDSNNVDTQAYGVKGDSLFFNFMMGPILNDRLILKVYGTGVDETFMKQ